MYPRKPAQGRPTVTTLKTRKPTGKVPWPLILLEGGEKSGKSWAAAVLSASPKVGRTLWIDLGEGAGDEYGAIPGVRYEMVEHDGTWQAIIGSVAEARDEAGKALADGKPPHVLVIDSMTLIWEMLKDWTTNRARRAPANQKLLRENPDAEINVSSNFWNDANTRHRKLMTMLMTFPGVVVMIARGKEVTAMTNGAPDPRKPKDYAVEGQKNLGFDSTVWVRLSRTEQPLIVGARSVHAGIKPGEDKPVRRPGLTLEQLIFDVLKCDPVTAHVRDLVEPKPGDAPPDELPMTDEQRETFMDLAKKTGLSRDEGLAFINEIIAPASVRSSAELSIGQANTVIARFTKFIAQQNPEATTQ